ncbi:energy transducer TonB [Algoriphagus sp. AGSA1]|uniref:energy transducer TonB n=1 Tax=Algoriphagus sp. AGSA1 TaxID=2907213 RepID=UPI001F2648BD|nr:energy transducer TonB [Algoriphagus sp. AGSA1]MCE7055040.1 energy transducer TonB [Algoriphagus sp. AGSA1]
MKKLCSLFFIVFLISTCGVFAQESGSIDAMNRLLSNNLKYPAELRQSETEGLVVVSVAVDPRGVMTGEYEVLYGELAFEQEVARMLNLLKENWDPSYLEGKTYGAEYLMSFDFKLSKGVGFPSNPNLTSSQQNAEVSPLKAVSQALTENPFSPKLYKNRAEILINEGQELRAEMDLNQAEFLENKMLTEIVIVGYLSEGSKSL